MRPEVQAEAPKNKENYQLVKTDPVDVYVAHNMSRDGKNIKLNLDLTGFWIVKKLYLKKAEEY